MKVWSDSFSDDGAIPGEHADGSGSHDGDGSQANPWTGAGWTPQTPPRPTQLAPYAPQPAPVVPPAPSVSEGRM